ncbi:hypothetical protein HELRODRAFT_162979 [Helobdella robusta]|uniref:Uncharacterized protein n=1 Tax=Helobdella robusta TaxID=6412 RepID=T1ETH3_HELRO|nr:hypothetical protein HELRODRAFT_162979 [Helobdella robusta]ESN99431.1 hypothetical protein HELRODRAFT_162979 [Helobdella robusta]
MPHKQSLHLLCWPKLIDFCKATRTRPAQPHFPNRISRLEMYSGPDRYKPQFDHILINTKCWRDKKDDLSNRLVELEDAAKKREQHWRTSKIINVIGKPLATTVNVRLLDSSISDSKNDILKDWITYFENLLNNKCEEAVEAIKPSPKPNMPGILTQKSCP